VSLFLELLPRFTLTGTGELGTSFYSNEDEIPSSNFKISDNKKTLTPDGVRVFLKTILIIRWPIMDNVSRRYLSSSWLKPPL
jgi:hypothetical protein